MNPHSYAPIPPMPGGLKAVRVLLIIRVVLAALIYTVGFVSLAAISGTAGVEAELGMSVGAVALLMLVGVAITAFEIYVVATMGRGGLRAQTLLRVVVGLGVASALITFLSGDNPFLGLILMIVILILIQSQAAKTWFHATEYGKSTPPGQPGVQPPAQY